MGESQEPKPLLPKERAYAINGDAVRTRRIEQGIKTPRALAQKADMSEDRIIQIEKGGKRVYANTLISIANALNAEWITLIEKDRTQPKDTHTKSDEVGLGDGGQSLHENATVLGESTAGVVSGKRVRKVITIDADYQKFIDEHKDKELINKLSSAIDALNEIIIHVVKKGSVIIELEMSEDDGKKLEAAFENGKLVALGITRIADLPSLDDGQLDRRSTADEVSKGSSEPDSPSRIVRHNRWKRIHRPATWLLATPVRVPAFLSLLLFLSGCVPIDARPFYGLGIGLAVAGLALAHMRKSGYVLPLVAMILNIIALALWPHVIGIFPNQGGFRFGVGQRSVANPPSIKKPKGIFFTLGVDGNVLWNNPKLKGMEIWVDGNNMTHMALGQGEVPWAFPSGDIEIGVHVFQLRRDGIVITQEIVTMSPESKEPVEVKFKLPK